MSQLADILRTNAECLALLQDRPAMPDSPYAAVQSALTRARQGLIAAAFRAHDADAIAALTPAERRSFGQTNQPSGAVMKRFKLVAKAKKIKAAKPKATTADVFGFLAAGEPVGSIEREALSVAGATDTIKALRKRAGL